MRTRNSVFPCYWLYQTATVVLLVCSVLISAQAQDQDKKTNWPEEISKLETEYRRYPSLVAQQLAIAHNNYGLELADQGQWNQAITHLEKARKIYPNSKDFTQNLSRTYFNKAMAAYNDRKGYSYKTTHYQLIKKDLFMATHLDPNFAEAYVLLGDVAYDSQNLKEARQMWEKAQTLDPKTKHIDERLNKLTNEQSVEGSFDKMSAAYFDLRFQDGIGRDTGFDVRQHLLDARRLVGSDFRYWPKHQIIVLLYDHETYRKSRTDTPEWSGGAYDGKIRIPVPDKQYMEAWAKQVIYHEYTHALVHDLAGNNCPQWFNEGLAEYQGHRDREARIQQLAAAHAKGTVPTWEELNTYFSASSSAEHAALGYQTAHSIVAYLAERYGFWRLRQVLADLGSGINFQEALEKALKTKPNRIEANWRAWLPRFITRGAKG